MAAGYQPGQGDDQDGGYVERVLGGVRGSSPGTGLTEVGQDHEWPLLYVTGDPSLVPRSPELVVAAAVGRLPDGPVTAYLPAPHPTPQLACWKV